MTHLLDRPLKAFTLYALLILLCSIPVYYVVVDSIWLNELDEHNQIIRQRIEKQFVNNNIAEQELKNTLQLWNALQPGTMLVRINSIQPDKFYTIIRQNESDDEGEQDRFRGFSTTLFVNGNPYLLSVETNVEEVDETLIAITLVTVAFFIFLVVGFILLNKQIARKIWLPFNDTLQKLQGFDLNSPQNISFEKTNIVEFEALNSQLETLLLRNQQAYNQQKDFIANASHELQTPLAVLKFKVDVLLQNESLSAEQAELIAAINLPLARMSRINKNLLLLSKIENSQFSDTEHIAIDALLAESLDLLSAYIEAKSIEVTQHITGPFELLVNRSLLEMLLNNLLINAIRYNTNQGIISITLANKTLVIANSGSEALNSENLFKRFGVSSNQSSSSGLGLAIVKEVCKRYEWQVNYNFQHGLHVFTVKF